MTTTQGQRRKGAVAQPAVDRVMRRVKTVEMGYGTPCWLWQGCVSKRGYGKVGSRVNGRYKFEFVHRVVHAARYGPIPPGYQLDHLCAVPHCVRHTEAVTSLENNRRQQLRRRPEIPVWTTAAERYIYHCDPSRDEPAMPLLGETPVLARVEVLAAMAAVTARTGSDIVSVRDVVMEVAARGGAIAPTTVYSKMAQLAATNGTSARAAGALLTRVSRGQYRVTDPASPPPPPGTLARQAG